jgi:hypothetical protein
MNRPHAQKPPAIDPDPRVSNVSGKIVILAIVAVALAAAGTSWWFRYNATRKTAEFWGAEVTRLIRDAPHVELLRLAPSASENEPGEVLDFRGEKYKLVARIDASAAPGMTHLRNALLEDRSFDAYNIVFEWSPHHWRWALVFRNRRESATILFAEDCMYTTLSQGRGQTARCASIAAGLREMFAEFSSQQPTAAR